MQVSDKDDDGRVYIRMDERHHRFILIPSDYDDAACFGWEVRNEQELDAIASQVEAAGITVTPGTREEVEARKVLNLIKFNDPSGFPLEVYYGAQLASQPFYPSRASSGFRTGDMGLGHGVIHYPGVNEGVKFYRDILGFRISDVGGVGAFMHVNPRHHSLAMFERRPEMKTRMNHFMVQYNEIDDIGIAYDICRERGDKFNTAIGRHPNDQNISFYVHNPSGWHTECGWGQRSVDDSVWESETYSRTENYWNHRSHMELEANLGRSS
jgi:2,3-dihydroxyethylbenzene 1,2-dioxygenase